MCPRHASTLVWMFCLFGSGLIGICALALCAVWRRLTCCEARHPGPDPIRQRAQASGDGSEPTV